MNFFPSVLCAIADYSHAMLKAVGEWKEQVNWKKDQNPYEDNSYIWNPNNLKYLRNREKKHRQKG